jgi:hypothetical protein
MQKGMQVQQYKKNDNYHMHIFSAQYVEKNAEICTLIYRIISKIQHMLNKSAKQYENLCKICKKK